MLKVIPRSSGVIQGQISKQCCIQMKLGTYSKHEVAKMFKVIPRSSEVIKGQITKHCCI